MVKERKLTRTSRAGKFWKIRRWKRRARVESGLRGRRRRDEVRDKVPKVDIGLRTILIALNTFSSA